MQGNKSKNTRPELVVRTYLREHGLNGYRVQWKQASGKPDVAFPGRRVAIFVHGCFWHRCPFCNPSSPRTNVEFWHAKFERNRARDERNLRELVAEGWTVVVVWECRLKKRRVRRTMEEVAALVRRAPRVVSRRDVRPGRVVVLGRTYVHGSHGLAMRNVRARKGSMRYHRS